MSRHLREEDILNILGDGTVSDIDLSDDEDVDERNHDNFPHEELEEMLVEFDDELFNIGETIENEETVQ
jgi:hypothetical protein